MITSYKCVDTKRLLVTNWMGETQSKEEMSMFGRRATFMDDYFKLAALLQKLHLDETEEALMIGMAVLSRGMGHFVYI